MFRIFSCLVFILTNTVMAQASSLSGSVRLESQKWVTSYVGETEVDGLHVTVHLDEARNSLEIPDIMVGVNSLVPIQSPTPKRSFRLNLIVSHNPTIRTSYELQPRTVSFNGSIRQAYVSNLDHRDFQFVATVEPDSGMIVSYSRKTAVGTIVAGQFLLQPYQRPQ